MLQVLTEEEAKQKKCPVRQTTGTTCYCLGSECMKWDWYYKRSASNTMGGYIPQPNMVKTDKGSCGL